MATPREPRFLPMSRGEMRNCGWDALDVLLVSGDAYVDHPAFGVALIARCLHSSGLRVGIVAQPRWDRIDDVMAMGAPRLFVGVTAGNLDSMLNKLTAQKKTRSLDAYSPNGEPGQRPNRAAIVYAQLCRQAFPGVPIVLGGIEASLRRIAHYDFWSDSVRRSVVLDAKAELLVFGMGESTIVSVANHLRSGSPISELRNLVGTAYGLSRREVWEPLLQEKRAERHSDQGIVALPSYEEVAADRMAFSRMTRLFERETNPFNARPLIQPHGNEAVYLNPPPMPLSTNDYDAIHSLPFQRKPHPRYADQRIPAFETVKDSVVALRGCYGGCSFCSISEHAGRIVQNRSEASVLAELRTIAQSEEFHGTITDLGGPTANMYRTGCRAAEQQQKCRRSSCLYPSPCRYLDVDQTAYISLLRKARSTPRVRHVFIASGIRYDLANLSAPFVSELASHHVGGQLSVAPEHVASNTLHAMRKPDVESYERFVARFLRQSQQARRDQYVVPYFVVGHPGTTLSDAVELALYLKRAGLRPRQVQEFIPTPMTVATSMYYTGLDPINDRPVFVERGPRARRLQKALALYYDESQADLVREALVLAKRTDLIGTATNCLVNAARGQNPNRQQRQQRVRASHQTNRGTHPRSAR